MFRLTAEVLLEHVFHKNKAVLESEGAGLTGSVVMTSLTGTVCFNSDLLKQQLAAKSHSGHSHVLRASVTLSTTCDERSVNSGFLPLDCFTLRLQE